MLAILTVHCDKVRKVCDINQIKKTGRRYVAQIRIQMLFITGKQAHEAKADPYCYKYGP